MRIADRFYNEREFDHTSLEAEYLDGNVPVWDEAAQCRRQELSWQEEESYRLDRRSDRWGDSFWEGDEDEDYEDWYLKKRGTSARCRSSFFFDFRQNVSP